jgi:hypothetical protein
MPDDEALTTVTPSEDVTGLLLTEARILYILIQASKSSGNENSLD